MLSHLQAAGRYLYIYYHVPLAFSNLAPFLCYIDISSAGVTLASWFWLVWFSNLTWYMFILRVLDLLDVVGLYLLALAAFRLCLWPSGTGQYIFCWAASALSPLPASRYGACAGLNDWISGKNSSAFKKFRGQNKCHILADVCNCCPTPIQQAQWLTGLLPAPANSVGDC